MIKDKLQKLIDKRAEDEGLWFQAQTAPKAYLQQELRKLHKEIENRKKETIMSPELEEMAEEARLQEEREKYGEVS